MKLRRRGFTLIELLLSLTLVALAMALGLVSFNKGRAQATTRSLGEVVLEEFRLARETAQASNVPVAVVIPSAGGTTASSQSLYILQGDTVPQITRTVSFSGDYPNALLFAGYWPVSVAKLTNPALTPTTVPPPSGTLGSLNLTNWNMPHSSDYAYIFLPSGAVVSNGLVTFDGNYHLAIGQGAAATPSGPPAGPAGSCNSFLLLTIGDPQTLIISPLGHLELQSGLVGADDSAVAYQTSPLNGLGPAQPISSVPSSNPIVSSSDWAVLPSQTNAVLTAGTTAGVAADEYLTFSVNATDPDGYPLFCQWSSAANASNPDPGNGSFSQINGQLQRMDWNNADGKYEATIEWRPPANATPSDNYSVTCNVTDGHGGLTTVTGSVVTQPLVNYHRKGHIYATDGSGNLWSLLGDGTKVHQLTYVQTGQITSVDFCSATADGCKVVCSPNSTLGLGGGIGDCGAMNADGTGVCTLFIYPGYLEAPDMSNEGLIAGQQISGGSGTHAIRIMNPDGTNPQDLTAPPAGCQDRNVRWSPDNTKLLFIRDNGATSDLYVISATGAPGSEVRYTNSGAWDACWSPDGTQIAFRDPNGLNKMPAAPLAPPTNLVPAGVASTTSNCVRTTAWSPDGQNIAFSGAGGQAYSCSAVDGSNTQQVGTLSNLWSMTWVP